MKFLIITLFLTATSMVMSQSGKATTIKKTFNRTTTISQELNASPETIWGVLTDASNFANWNSTIVSLEGNIELKEKIRLVSRLDTSRTFKLKVKEFVPNTRLVWGDGMGERVYSLEKKGDVTVFTMTEKIGGFMFPLFANKIPSFDASFEQFVADLKTKVESK